MALDTALTQVHWLSIGAAGLSAFVVGGLWYGPLFGRTWMAEFGFTEASLAERNLPMVFGLALLLSVVAALFLDLFIGASATLASGALAGLLAATGWVITFVGIYYLFEMRSIKAWLVNAGYALISMTVMGAILGAW